MQNFALITLSHCSRANSPGIISYLSSKVANSEGLNFGEKRDIFCNYCSVYQHIIPLVANMSQQFSITVRRT